MCSFSIEMSLWFISYILQAINVTWVSYVLYYQCFAQFAEKNTLATTGYDTYGWPIVVMSTEYMRLRGMDKGVDEYWKYWLHNHTDKIVSVVHMIFVIVGDRDLGAGSSFPLSFAKKRDENFYPSFYLFFFTFVPTIKARFLRPPSESTSDQWKDS